MSTAQNLIDYTAALREEPDRWLGLLVLYSVTETVVQHDALEQLLTDNGLDKFVPRKPADVDVFRRTCTSAQRKRVATPDPGVYQNVLIRDVANDDEVVKRIVNEFVDQKGRRLDFHEAYDLVFTKASGQVRPRRIGNIVTPAADEVAMEVVREYRRLVGTVDGACIRTVIGRVLDGSHAVSMRQGGGVYFIDRTQAHVAAGLERFGSAIDGTSVTLVPLPNDAKQRDNLVEAVTDEAKVEIERAITEVAELLKSGKPVSGALMATLAGRYQTLTDKAERYAGLLDVTLGSVRAALTVLDAQMAELALVTPKKVALADVEVA